MNSKNQFVRSSKSYEVGGSTESSQQDDACWPPWKKKCRAGQTRRVWRAGDVAKLVGKVVGGFGAAALGFAELKNKSVSKWVKNTFDNNKNGGKIKYKRK